MKKITILYLMINMISLIDCKYITNIHKDIYINNRKPYYIIEYNPNSEEEQNSLENQIIKYGEVVTLKNNIYNKEGYIFKEWNTNKDGSGTSYLENQEITNLTTSDKEKIILYAIWTKLE